MPIPALMLLTKLACTDEPQENLPPIEDVTAMDYYELAKKLSDDEVREHVEGIFPTWEYLNFDVYGNSVRVRNISFDYHSIPDEELGVSIPLYVMDIAYRDPKNAALCLLRYPALRDGSLMRHYSMVSTELIASAFCLATEDGVIPLADKLDSRFYREAIPKIGEQMDRGYTAGAILRVYDALNEAEIPEQDTNSEHPPATATNSTSRGGGGIRNYK